MTESQIHKSEINNNDSGSQMSLESKQTGKSNKKMNIQSLNINDINLST